MRVTDQAALWCVVFAPLWLAATASLTSGDAEAAAVPAAVSARRSLIDTRSHDNDNGVERVGFGKRSIHDTRSPLPHKKRLIKQAKLLVTRQSTTGNSTSGEDTLLGGLLGGSGSSGSVSSGSDAGAGSGSGSGGSDSTNNTTDTTITTGTAQQPNGTNNSTPTPTANVPTTTPPVVVPTSNTSKVPPPTTTPRTKVNSTPPSIPTSTPTPATSTVTNTSQTTSTPSPSPTATTANDTANKPSSSGLSKTALIIIIAVASSVGFIGLVWTIIRKTAFGTSKRFDAKLEPIEWTEPVEQHHRDETYPYGSLGGNARNGSLRGTTVGASAASLGRSDSDKGSERGGMAEVYPHTIPYNGPAYVAAPYYGNAPANQYGARPGYPHEQASFGYADLQRGGSVATSAGSGHRAATPGGYDYAAQARAMHQNPRY